MGRRFNGNSRRNKISIADLQRKMMVGVAKQPQPQQQQQKEEDRISKLPDELLRQILSNLDSRDAVQTSVLSKRWVYIWTTLPILNLESDPHFHHFFRRTSYSEFATNFLKYRNQQSRISTITIYCDSGIFQRNCGTFKIVQYALCHNVEHLRICNVDLGSFTCLNSTFIKTLHLTSCDDVNPTDWAMPNLTSLHLEHVRFGDQISGFNNLKELTLVGYFAIFYAPEIFTINCPNLECLTLGPDLPRVMFIVSAPKLLYFEFRSGHVPGFSAGDGFPCIKEVDIDIEIKNDDWAYYDEDRIKRMMQNFVTMLNAVRGTPLLKLSKETMQVLGRIPDFSQYQPSPLGNLKCLSLQGLYEKPSTSTDHVINYLLKNSPCAEILKGHLGRIPKLQNKIRVF